MTRPILDARTNVQMAGYWKPNFPNSKNEDNPTKTEDNLTQKNDPTQKMKPTWPKKLRRSLQKNIDNPTKNINWSHL